MNMASLVFYVFVTLAGLSAGAMLFSKNVFKSALYLLVCLLSVAALYVLALAEFLAVAQILIYAGGILVVIIFAVMLTTRISGSSLVVRHRHVISAGFASTTLFVLLVLYLPDLPGLAANHGPGHADITTIGIALFSAYTLPFEIAGILLLVALVGAAVITSQLKSNA